MIKNDLTKVGMAYHICELVDSLCPEGQEQRAVFELLHTTLVRLCTDEDMAVVIHNFELQLLSLLGYWQGADTAAATLDTQVFIEGIIEKKLKSRRIFTKLT